MTNNLMPYNWKRKIIDFKRWSHDAYGVYEFTPRNYQHFFRFDIQPAGTVVRVFVLHQPGYGRQAAHYHVTRRVSDRDGRVYIDIDPGREPKTVPEALAYAVLWAEATSEYISGGRMSV